ncbi:MAG TPA: hypothetical protein VHY08_25230 [Bacillota bacterium]|nr:hypothetical protein [Bacillota bacterium]
MKKPGLFLCIIIFLLVVAGILLVISVGRPAPPSKAFLVRHLEPEAYGSCLNYRLKAGRF